jgi:cbb3-type cytochrome oxidase maturation protein
MTKVSPYLDKTHLAPLEWLLSCAKIICHMKIIFLLIIVSLIVALGFLSAFLWAVRNGQYDDDYTPSVRILFDDEPQSDNSNS